MKLGINLLGDSSLRWTCAAASMSELLPSLLTAMARLKFSFRYFFCLARGRIQRADFPFRAIVS